MNILLIVCDTLRVDHLGCYGYFRNTSPNIDSIAKNGVVFEDFYNAGAPTGPGFTCMYTGLHSIRHKHYYFIEPNIRQVDDTIFTMPEILRACEYTTVAIDNLINFLSHSKHWIRGYDFYINPSQALDFPANLMAEDVTRRLIPCIKHHSDEKFFLFVHYWDPHTPYNQPQKYREIFHHNKGDISDLEVREAPAGYKYVPGWGKIGEFPEGEIYARGSGGQKVSIDLYDGEIAYMDHEIGEAISTLEDEGIFDETLIIITSDHGEVLRQQFWGHIPGLYDTVTHIPLIMRYPKNLPRGMRVKGFCQHIDLLPTLLDFVGATSVAPKVDGESIIPLLKNEKIKDRIFMENSCGQRAIRTEEWKLVNDEWTRRPQRGPELYNIEEDPMETNNLANTYNEKMKELRETLREWVKNNLKEGEKDPAIYEHSEYDELVLRSMEYYQKIANLKGAMRTIV